MPIYEYLCNACDAKFEQLQRTMNSEAKVPCPSCGSEKTVRAMSVFAVGAEGAKPSVSAGNGMCGRCGGPGPCGSGN